MGDDLRSFRVTTIGFPETPLPAANCKESDIWRGFVPSDARRLGDPKGTGSPRRTDCAISSLFEIVLSGLSGGEGS